MARYERVTPYKLEQHLNEMCSSDPTYTNLLSTWNINKKACQDALSTVVMSYPHYTKHDISHCEAVITAIEKLLGEETIRTLSPTDTWLLLQAAYLHDIGMVIECKRIEENWKTEEFQEYLHESEESSDKSLAESAKYINSFRNASTEEDVLSWPVNVRYAVTLLIADYYRRRHAKDSDLYVQDMGKVFHIDLGFNGLIQSRLVYLLADIVGLHGEACDKVLELDYVTDGFNADFAHPRFLAEMLRMGDLLDADNNRFNDTNELVFGKIPESSKNHWEKHRSVRHLLVTPDVIEYRADCDKLKVYREHRRFLTILKEEITFWTFHWKDIMPEDINGSAPKLGRCELLLNGVPDVQGISDLRFWISQEKAFEILEGANIYDDQFVFLREVIQNALDACKVQMWRDLREERYRGWMKGPIDKTIQPFEIEDEIFNNYVIQVKICNYDKEHVKIIVKDNGTGISVDQLKKICNVGVSYLGDKERKREIESMPAWLRPTAGFGIGLQSIFLVAEEFTIYSKSSDDQGICATIASSRKGGYVEIVRDDTVKSRGTEVHVVLLRKMGLKRGSKNIYKAYMEEDYDPFATQNNLVYYKILDALIGNIENTYFPVEVFWDEKKIKTFAVQRMNEFGKELFNNRYRIKQVTSYGMELWDIRTYTRLQISLIQKYANCDIKYSFKGMDVDVDSFYHQAGIEIRADFCGLDAKRALTLDRKKIKTNLAIEIYEIIDSAVKCYLEQIKKQLFAEDKIRNEEEYNRIYIYWCIVPLEVKLKLLKEYADIFQKVKTKVSVLKKEVDGQFVKREIDFKEVMEDLGNVAMISELALYLEYNERSVDIGLIKSFLKRRKVCFSIIIIDVEFTNILDTEKHEKIMIIPGRKYNLYLLSYSTHEELLETVDGETEEYLIKILLKEKISTTFFSYENDSVRRYMPGIKKYAPICVASIPAGVIGEWDPYDSYIISPVTIKQWNAYKNFEYDEFIGKICSSVEYGNLVEYVYYDQVEERKYSREEIEGTYEKLIKKMYLLSGKIK